MLRSPTKLSRPFGLYRGRCLKPTSMLSPRQNQFRSQIRQFSSNPQKMDDHQSENQTLYKDININVIDDLKTALKQDQTDNEIYDQVKEIIEEATVQKYVRQFQSQSEWTRLERYSNKIGFHIENLIYYISDMRYLRAEALQIKTSQFLKRNYQFSKETCKHIVHELKNVVKGFRRLKTDVKYVIKTTYRNNQDHNKYRKVSAIERAKIRQIRKDVIKFIPFSFFLIIPGMELLLPPFLVVFPDSVPSQFISEEKRLKKFSAISKRRKDAALKLDYMFPIYLKAIEQDKDILKGDTQRIQNLQDYIRESYKPESLPTDLLQYKEIFRRYADFRYFEVEALERMAHFLGITPVTGVNVINNLLSVTGREISITAPGVKHIAKFLMVRELNMYMNRIRRYDNMHSFHQIDQLSEVELDIVCFRRGIELDGRTLNQKKEDLKHWMSISNCRNVPNSLLIYTRIHDTVAQHYKIEDFESEELNQDQKERKQLFENTFGVNFLVDKARKIGNKIGDVDQYDPINHEFLINQKDLHQTMGEISTFKNRNDMASENVKTYRLVRTLIQMHRKKTIIEYYLTGRQRELMKTFPHFERYSQLFLGKDLYNDLQQYPEGHIFSSDDPNFKELMKKEIKIKDAIKNDYKLYIKYRGLDTLATQQQENQLPAINEDDVFEENGDFVSDEEQSGQTIETPQLLMKKSPVDILMKDGTKTFSEIDDEDISKKKMNA